MNGIQMFPAIARRLATVLFVVLFVGCADESVDTPSTTPAPTTDAGVAPASPSTTDASDATPDVSVDELHEECNSICQTGDLECVPMDEFEEILAGQKDTTPPIILIGAGPTGSEGWPCVDPCEGLYIIQTGGGWTCPNADALVNSPFTVSAVRGECLLDIGYGLPRDESEYRFDPSKPNSLEYDATRNGDFDPCYR